MAKTTHQPLGKKGQKKVEKFRKGKHHRKPQQTYLTSSPLHAAFESFT